MENICLREQPVGASAWEARAYDHFHASQTAMKNIRLREQTRRGRRVGDPQNRGYRLVGTGVGFLRILCIVGSYDEGPTIIPVTALLPWRRP